LTKNDANHNLYHLLEDKKAIHHGVLCAWFSNYKRPHQLLLS
jgi:hypothetical protein